MRRELAVAILLWKATRMTNKVKKIEGGNWLPNESFDAAMCSVDMAKKAGVLEEYMEALDEFPVLKVDVKRLEKWKGPKKAFGFNGRRV